MTRSCFALTLLLLVLGVSLYAIRNAQGQTHLDARLGSARNCLCPLLGDEVHRCGFGMTPHAAGRFQAPSFSKSVEFAERLCPLAFADDIRAESQVELVPGSGTDAESLNELTKSTEAVSIEPRATPPTDPYPLNRLPASVKSAEVTFARYFSGHDPLYDAVVYGEYPSLYQPPVELFEETDFLPVEVVEACRRPLAHVFNLEDSVAVNYGYVPAQLEQGLGTRGALRVLGQLPRRLHQRAMDSALLGNIQCELADVAYRSRRQFPTPTWLAGFQGPQSPHVAAGRPMVTEQVTVEPEDVSSQEEDRTSPPEVANSVTEPHRSSEAYALAAPHRVLVKSLAVSLDKTARMLQNASRQLQQLAEN
jgi:hypothetical protein